MQSSRSKRLSSLLVFLASVSLLMMLPGCATEDEPQTLLTDEQASHGSQRPADDACITQQHGDGCDTKWTVLQKLPDGYPLTDVSGSSSSDVYVVGWQTPYRFYLPGNTHGRILNYDGFQWVDDPNGPEATLFAIDIDSRTKDAYIVGERGTVAHKRPGNNWQAVPTSITADLADVFIDRKARTAYAAGDNGTLLRITGQNVTSIDTGTTADLNAIWGTGNVGIVGDGGTYLKYNKRAGIAHVPTGTTVDLNGIWGTGNVGIWGTGNVGRQGIWGTGNVGIIVGDGGTILQDDPSGVHAVPSPTTADLNAIWGTGNVGIIVGDGGALLVKTRSVDWTPVTLTFNGQPFSENLTSVWGTSSRDIFVTSDDGTVLHFGLH